MDVGTGGRVALVMGASRGIGRVIARSWQRRGARVAIASRSADALAVTAAAIGARAFPHDNADLGTIPRLIAAVTADMGLIDILVTNTGGPRPDLLVDGGPARLV
jgi:NAD(P)-dependent dehydrogenase (short-subunit alcohol dehydrogenase family)